MNTGNEIQIKTTNGVNYADLLAKLKTKTDNSANINTQEQFVKTSKSSGLFKKIGLGVLAASAITGVVASSPAVNTTEAHGRGNNNVTINNNYGGRRGGNNLLGEVLRGLGHSAGDVIFHNGHRLVPFRGYNGCYQPIHDCLPPDGFVEVSKMVPVYNHCGSVIGYKEVTVWAPINW